MAPTITLPNISQLTTEHAITAYFQSLGNSETRAYHIPIITAKGGPAPSMHDVRLDVRCWYGGFIALAQMLDPGCEVPSVNGVADGVTTSFNERGKSALAA